MMLTPANHKAVLELVATPAREIIFTTFLMDEAMAQLQFNKNFLSSLHGVGRMVNTMLISYDVDSCAQMELAGVPCWLDRVAPQPHTLPGQYASKVPHWFQKYWWAKHMTHLNYTVLFVDNDAVVLQDPLHHYDPSYDIQGLSDWNWLTEPPSPLEIVVWGCPLYKTMNKAKSLGGQEVVYRDDTAKKPLEATNPAIPCQSTGLWFAQPTPAAHAFFRDLLDLLTRILVEQWDQAAWNEVLMGHLFGLGEAPPLRYRLLPMAQYNNIGTYHLRQQHALPLDTVILHAGAVHGPNKVAQYKALGFWSPEAYEKSAGLVSKARVHAALHPHQPDAAETPAPKGEPAAEQDTAEQSVDPPPAGREDTPK
ncbi:hypothetical protein WJX72_005258 [[Myrmecia] bisecta]|uniref:Nucleotide-diphospho-sugar transferase domain-containing protein n=1 Tax=[Myrmecia] bisecta TaxID=41462 RepID=A0AAW1Q4N4_9CHLO